ncbi:mCG6124, partial [Mus musculus]
YNFRTVSVCTRPSSLSTPHLVIRRRSPRDPRITGPAGRVKWCPTWSTRYDCPPDNGLRIKEVPRRQRNSGTVHRHFTRVSSTDVGSGDQKAVLSPQKRRNLRAATYKQIKKLYLHHGLQQGVPTWCQLKIQTTKKADS